MKRTIRLQRLNHRLALLQKTLQEQQYEEWIELNRDKVNSCWKYLNSYGCHQKESDSWWMYKRIRGINNDHPSFRSFTFETTAYGDLKISDSKTDVLNGWIPCSEQEYRQAWNLFIGKINDIRP